VVRRIPGKREQHPGRGYFRETKVLSLALEVRHTFNSGRVQRFATTKNSLLDGFEGICREGGDHS